MNWEDEGFLISKRKFRENANIIDVFTSRYGKVTGIVYGGNSRKIRNYLQISKKISLMLCQSCLPYITSLVEEVY